MIDPQDITGLVLAGGRGSRMGGVDKGLQSFMGQPLALNALMRLQPQVGRTLVNANRNLPAYAAFGAPVCPDALTDYPGPLAGFMTGLQRCETAWLLTVPCDTPLFPHDLAARLAAATDAAGADIAMAAARQADDRTGEMTVRTQPVFCLMRVSLLDSLVQFIQAGGRKIGRWTDQHACAVVPFDQPGDDPRAFLNANTPAELQALQEVAAP
ncbi:MULTISPECIES: molybdenum cofactor guanylyltransferase MobA [unclassified Acidovorax]|uniref:molybdenum cofactor guanylyltransferase MobA n=1 Tax=unclassified Acidovorax TaxID=2684926 RepID=UPI0028831AA8|nr:MULTISPECIES: molybdenum cofactor guanylyltransferase MobA [unclassified Acidovorax]